ncbi:MAG: type 1 glutamine amidotransferase [Candidatus Aminicenantes bacterium]|nr:type 1 glutamine amidotransferase [Candidatus Aminicenantes bacterium]
MSRQIKLAIIDNSIDLSVYTPVKHWDACLNAPWRSFRAKTGSFPVLGDGYTHIVLTGSEASILERERWVDTEIALVKDAVELGIPVLGSCWGHQLLAVAFAGIPHVRRAPKPEVGWYPITITEDNRLFGRPGRTAHIFNSHFDEVTDLGSEFLVFASTEDCTIHAFQLKDKPVWGIQSHPEMSITAAHHYLKSNIARHHEASHLFQNALESHPEDSGSIREIVTNFLNYKAP